MQRHALCGIWSRSGSVVSQSLTTPSSIIRRQVGRVKYCWTPKLSSSQNPQVATCMSCYLPDLPATRHGFWRSPTCLVPAAQVRCPSRSAFLSTADFHGEAGPSPLVQSEGPYMLWFQHKRSPSKSQTGGLPSLQEAHSWSSTVAQSYAPEKKFTGA